KQLTPVRLLKNKFYFDIKAAEDTCADKEKMEAILGRARAKKGMFEGDLEEGELEIGQVSALIKKIMPAADIVKEIRNEFEECLHNPLK
ncbi:MAG: nitronate monooxygenase, partial [Ferruginibacter sp.]